MMFKRVVYLAVLLFLSISAGAQINIYMGGICMETTPISGEMTTHSNPGLEGDSALSTGNMNTGF